MAPEINANTCGNCRHRRRKSTYPRCVGCRNDQNPDNRYPRWQAPEIIDGQPQYDAP